MAIFGDDAFMEGLARLCGAHFAEAPPNLAALATGSAERRVVALELLRTEAGRDPFNPSLTGLIGELSTRSEEFRALWADHNVRLHRTGLKHFRHPAVGLLDLTFDALEIPTDPGLTLTAYTAEPGSPSDENLKLLASWAATLDQDAAAHDATSQHHLT